MNKAETVPGGHVMTRIAHPRSMMRSVTMIGTSRHVGCRHSDGLFRFNPPAKGCASSTAFPSDQCFKHLHEVHASPQQGWAPIALLTTLASVCCRLWQYRNVHETSMPSLALPYRATGYVNEVSVLHLLDTRMLRNNDKHRCHAYGRQSRTAWAAGWAF